MCVGFWAGIAVLLFWYFLPVVVLFFVVTGLGLVIYQAANRWLPCNECSAPADFADWRKVE